MKTYNRIMEIFWLCAGVLLLGYSAYTYFVNGDAWDDITMTFYPALMAIILAAFRMIVRSNNQDGTNG